MKESKINKIINAIRSVVCPDYIVDMHRTIVGLEKDREMEEKCAACPCKQPPREEKAAEAEGELWIPDPEPPMSELERSAAVFLLSSKYNLEEKYIKWWLKFYEAGLRVKYKPVVGIPVLFENCFPGQYVMVSDGKENSYGYVSPSQIRTKRTSIEVLVFRGQKNDYTLANSIYAAHTECFIQ